MGQATLAVVGEHQDLVLLDQGQETILHRSQHFMSRNILEVHPQQLLLVRHHAQLDGGVDRGVAMQVGLHVAGAEQRLQRTAGLVVADHAQHAYLGAQRGGVARHVGGAAEAFVAALDLHHRHRRFRRDALDIAKPIAVEHHVARHQDARLIDLLLRNMVLAHGHPWQHGPVRQPGRWLVVPVGLRFSASWSAARSHDIRCPLPAWLRARTDCVRRR